MNKISNNTKKKIYFIIGVLGFVIPVMTHLSLWTFGFIAGIGYMGWTLTPDEESK